MRTEPQRLFLMLISTAMLLAGCTGNQMQNNGEPADPEGSTPPIAPSIMSDNSEENSSQTDNKTLDAQYMQGEFWRSTEDSADLLLLDSDETPASYFEQIQSQVTAEAERHIQDVYLPAAEDLQVECGGTKTGDTFYQDTRIDSLEPAGVFCKDGTRYLVYTMHYSAQIAPGTQLSFVGGMGLDDDGWMNPGLGRMLVFSLGDDGSIQLSFGCQEIMYSRDTDSGLEFFLQDLRTALGLYLAGERVE